MAAATRLYLVIDATNNEALIDATSPATAIRFVAGNDKYQCKAATASDVARLMAKGIVPLRVKPEQITLGDQPR